MCIRDSGDGGFRRRIAFAARSAAGRSGYRQQQAEQAYPDLFHFSLLLYLHRYGANLFKMCIRDRANAQPQADLSYAGTEQIHDSETSTAENIK